MTSRPLILTRDPDLLDDVQRLALAAGLDPVVHASAAEARRDWQAAPMVLLGEDLAAEAASIGLPRRSDVVLVTHDAESLEPWPLAVAVGAEHVVALPVGETSLLGRLATRGSSGPRAAVVGVVGGSGGAGASVLAVAAALAGGRLGHDVLLVDADPDCAGLDLALAAEDVPGARWRDLAAVTGSLAADTLRTALPFTHDLHLLSVDRVSDDPLPRESLLAVLDSAVASFDLVVVDLPRTRDDVLLALAPRCDVVLVVLTPDVRGAAAAARVVRTLRPVVDLRAVVRALPGADVDTDELASWLELPVAAEIAHDPRLTAALDRGEPPGASARSRLGRTCTQLMSSLVRTR